MTDTSPEAGAAAQAMIVPLALAQFIASYAATNMNVAISAIARDLGTTVAGVRRCVAMGGERSAGGPGRGHRRRSVAGWFWVA